MIVCYSFVGKLPNYIIDTIYQARLFFKGDIYLILDDFKSPYLQKIKDFSVNLIPYKEVINNDFLEVCKKRGNKIAVINGLGHRRLLFLRSMERFFLLENLMKKQNLENILFLELDNLIYQDPNIWQENLDDVEFTFLHDNDKRISTGLMYIKNTQSINIITENLKSYVSNEQGFISEMGGNWLIKDKAYFLPTYWENEKYNKMTFQNYDKFNSIFDAASIGWYLYGSDKIHDCGRKNPWGEIDYTIHRYEWIEDEEGRRKPYIVKDNEKILINNLHIPCKELNPALSKPLN